MSKSTEERQRYLKLRIGVLTSLIAFGALAILHKAWDLQVLQADQWREAAEGQSQRDIKLSPRRGAIYDRDGAELAISVDVDSVWVSPTAMRKAKQDAGEVAHKLAELLGMDAKQIAQKIAKGKHFVYIKRRVTAAQGKAVRGLNLGGVYIEKEAGRF
jgi:cell division protein FtsI (penicillin-binding protein 3)